MTSLLSYHLRNALRSARRTPLLAVLMVLGLTIGITVFCTSTSFNRNLGLALDSMYRSDRLYRVQLDNWPRDFVYHPAQYQLDDYRPIHLTWQDARAITDSGLVDRAAPTFRTLVAVEVAGQPQALAARLTTRDFFAMFDAPVRRGGIWTPMQETRHRRVVVISHQLAQRAFAGRAAVGEELVVNGEPYRVVGVLGPWRPSPRVFDGHAIFYDTPSEELYLPLGLAFDLNARPEPPPFVWREGDAEQFPGIATSEANFVDLWVEMEPEQRATFEAWLDDYVAQQRGGERFLRNDVVQVYGFHEWLFHYSISQEFTVIWIVGLLLLTAATLSYAGLLLAKFMTRRFEVGLRRALGASRAQIFGQHVVEAVLYALTATACSLVGIVGMAWVFTPLMSVFGTISALHLPLIAAAMLVAVTVIGAASVVPAWAMSRTSPARHLEEPTT